MNTRGPKIDAEPLTRERMERLCRVYHSARWAAEATEHSANSLTRRAKQLGLSFRFADMSWDDEEAAVAA